MLKVILATNPKATKAKLIDQGSQYYLSRGDHKGARNFVNAATDTGALKRGKEKNFGRYN